MQFPMAFSSKRAVLSYAFDYAVVFVLMTGFLALDAIEPYHQQFSLRNYTLQYKFAVHERVPNLALVAIAVIAPIAIISIYTIVVDGIFSHKVNGRKRKYTWSERLWELNCGLLGLGLSISMQYVIVGSLKNAIGKPRPDLIDRCVPKAGSQDPLPFGLSNSTICTQKNNLILKDGFRSFPSGHSSTSFAGLFYLSLYLAAKLHVLDSRGEVWKLFVALTPSLGAALVAGSRIMDARHHPFDVISGSLIGITIAWLAYRQYFPPLSDFRAKGRAYPMRTWGTDSLSKREDLSVHLYQPPASQHDDEYPLAPVAAGNMPMEMQQPTSTGNVFRDEISASQRHRQQMHKPTPRRIGSPRAAGLESSPEQISPQSPPRMQRQRLERGGRGDAAWEVVGSDADEEAYEPREQYKPTGGGERRYDPYRISQPQTGDRAGDTEYKRPGVKPVGGTGESSGSSPPEIVGSGEIEAAMPKGV